MGKGSVERQEPLMLLAAGFIALCISGIHPHDREMGLL